MKKIKVWNRTTDPIDCYLDNYEGLNPVQLKEVDILLYNELVRIEVIVPVERIALEVRRTYEREASQAL